MSGDWSNKVIENPTLNEIITIKSDINYLNGSGPIIDLALSNFTAIWLQEDGITSTEGRIPATGNLNYSAHTTPFYYTGGSPPSWGGINHYYILPQCLASLPHG